ncbi:major facilitator superfamily domain-containing protein 1 [Tieghemostelium lacteum]|uniref:Lysosomal dipeptide transporter MFSD1 n=1 Tax=Tieghemostelium lacteum TaxID=361077 RepID=A0A151Z6L1_TIELA|nr:major facilitator superfamily domain-containing protein 1 [Tieghemostelium lacteum]|eukprot:KYQ89568.1 major facilitator superfamily domain-containing protein 1 [Tieghemostelium lacteum]
MSDDSSQPLISDGSKHQQEEKIPLRESLFRYLGLLFICLITFGSYYIYDIPGAFGANVLAPFYHTSTINYGILYSVYNFPNMIIVFFGGYFIDTLFGLRKGALIFCSLVMAGQIIFAISASTRLFWLAVIGRLIFGLGGESLSVAQSTFCASWFQGRPDINLAFAITLGFSRIGSAVNFKTTPAIADHANIPTAIWFGAITCGISFVSCIVLILLDVYRGKKDKKEAVTNDPVKLTDITKFSGSVWLVCLAVVLFYIPLFVFVTNGTDFIQAKWPQISPSAANTLVSIPYYTAAPSPVIGFIIDKVGRNLSWMTFASVLMAVAHILLTFSSLTPYVAMIIMGVGYACMAASIWVTFPVLVPNIRLGTAYGLAFACQNAAVALTTLIVDAILQKTDNNWYYVEGIFIGCALLGIMVHVILVLIDIKEKRINVPSADMKQKVKEINKESKPILDTSINQ